MRKKYLPTLLLLALSFPQIAFADPGHGLEGFGTNPMHWFTDAYHLIGMAVIGLGLLGVHQARGKLAQYVGVAAMATGVLIIALV